MWPAGTNFETIPADLMAAITHASMILGWREMLREEQPPRWMWCLDWELEKWFKDVAKKRDSKYGGDSSTSDGEAGSVFEENELFAEMMKKKDL